MEVWKPIKGFEGNYEISNLGRVRSIDRIIKAIYKTGAIAEKPIKGRILKPYLNMVGGYYVVTLVKDRKQSYLFVHRLVAEAFIPNPNNLPCVNHKDESRDNNCVDNLEWCTYDYNNNYGTKPERISKTLLGHSVSLETRNKIGDRLRGKKHNKN